MPFFADISLGFKIIAHSAGVKVKATMAEMATDTVMVMANCLYSTPMVPPRKATGMKMAASTAVVAMIGPCTSSMAIVVDSSGDRPSRSMCSSTFSMTTIASSTTIPMANTSAKRVSVLIVKSKTTKVAKVPMMETGTAKTGIKVVRHFCRNTKTTRMTKSNDSMKVISTSSMDALMKAVLSTTIL